MVESWVQEGIFSECRNHRDEGGRPLCLSPLAAVVKRSDVSLAKLLVGVEVTDSDSLAEANRLLSEGQTGKQIKVRPVTDMKASGANDLVRAPPFRASKVSHLLQHIQPGDYIGVLDIKQYFPAFSLAHEARHLFGIHWGGKPLVSARLNFGFRGCPYFAITFSAFLRELTEVKLARTLGSAEGKVAAMTDDFGLRGPTEAATWKKLELVDSVLHTAGLGTAKHRVGQQALYLGMLVDTVRGTISFDPVHAEATAEQIEEAQRIIQGRINQLPAGERSSLAGKFNWYSEVLQSGRTRTRMLYLYGVHGLALHDKQRDQLLDDLEWWLGVVRTWQAGKVSGLEYPILNAATLRADPRRLRVVQSDASGVDGHGYYYGSVDEPDPRFVACQWDEGVGTLSSHHDELYSLLHYARHTDDSDCLLIWVSDSSSAVWTVNKGRCREDQGLDVLRQLLDLLDRRRIAVVAIWVPREQNTLADRLSHLARLLDRHEVQGRLSEL